MNDELHMYVVYSNPSVHPGKHVVRHLVIGPAGLERTIGKEVVLTLEQARALVPPGLYCQPRDPNDEPQIVEVWF